MKDSVLKMTYDEFCEWAVQELINSLITHGFGGLRNTFRNLILNQVVVIYRNNGGFAKE